MDICKELQDLKENYLSQKEQIENSFHKISGALFAVEALIIKFDNKQINNDNKMNQGNSNER
jgi:hypothetical protein